MWDQRSHKTPLFELTGKKSSQCKTTLAAFSRSFTTRRNVGKHRSNPINKSDIMVWNIFTQATRTRFSVATGPAVRCLTFWSKTLEKIWPLFSAIIFFQGGRQRWCWQRYEDLQGLIRGSREGQRRMMSRTWDLNLVILTERADFTPAPLQFKFILSEHTSRASGLLWRYPSNLYSLCHI